MQPGGIRRIVVPEELGYPDYDWRKQGPGPSTFAVRLPRLRLPCILHTHVFRAVHTFSEAFKQWPLVIGRWISELCRM